MKLGFIGLGVMGRPMALHLMRAGHDMAVFARRPDAMQPLLAAGALLSVLGALLALVTGTIGGLVALLGGIAVITGVAFGFPIRA